MTEAGQCEAGAGAEEECGRGLNKWSLALCTGLLQVHNSPAVVLYDPYYPHLPFYNLYDNMDSQEFKVRGRQMVDYIIQYLEVSLDTGIFGG